MAPLLPARLRHTVHVVIPWDEKWWPVLRLADVYPLPLATETNWAGDGWEINLVLVGDVQESGYSTLPLWSYREPYGEGPQDQEVQAVHDRAMEALAGKLRALLND